MWVSSSVLQCLCSRAWWCHIPMPIGQDWSVIMWPKLDRVLFVWDWVPWWPCKSLLFVWKRKFSPCNVLQKNFFPKTGKEGLVTGEKKGCCCFKGMKDLGNEVGVTVTFPHCPFRQLCAVDGWGPQSDLPVRQTPVVSFIHNMRKGICIW